MRGDAGLQGGGGEKCGVVGAIESADALWLCPAFPRGALTHWLGCVAAAWVHPDAPRGRSHTLAWMCCGCLGAPRCSTGWLSAAFLWKAPAATLL